MRFKTAYDTYERFTSDCSGPSLTQQHFKDHTDIKILIDRYRSSDQIPYTMDKPPQYGDFVTGDFTEVMQIITAAQDDFMNLSSDLRARFSNNPAKFLDFVVDPKNLDEMRRLGLLRPDYSTPEEDEKKKDDEAVANLKRAKRAEVQLELPN